MPEFGTETVLVVDDELAVLSLAQLMLSRYGYSVLTAASGREALHLFEVWPEQHVDFAVIDIVMPGMDGLELATALRAIRPNLPILFTSAYSDRPELRPEKTRNIPYIAKPFSSIRLIGMMRDMLAQPPQAVPTTTGAPQPPTAATPPRARGIERPALNAALSVLRSYTNRTAPDPKVVSILQTAMGAGAANLDPHELACEIIEQYLHEEKKSGTSSRSPSRNKPDPTTDERLQ